MPRRHAPGDAYRHLQRLATFPRRTRFGACGRAPTTRRAPPHRVRVEAGPPSRKFAARGGASCAKAAVVARSRSCACASRTSGRTSRRRRQGVRPDALANGSVPWPLQLWLHIAAIASAPTQHTLMANSTVYEIRVVNSDNGSRGLRVARHAAVPARRVAASGTLTAGRRRGVPQPRCSPRVRPRPRRVAAERVGRGRGAVVRRQFLRRAGGAGPAGRGLLICPITQEEFYDPVITADGMTYERSAIERWLEHNHTSPSTNAELPHRHVVPNFALRASLVALHRT